MHLHDKCRKRLGRQATRALWPGQSDVEPFANEISELAFERLTRSVPNAALDSVALLESRPVALVVLDTSAIDEASLPWISNPHAHLFISTGIFPTDVSIISSPD